MLDGAGNTAGNVQIAGKFLSGHAHIAVQRNVLQSFRHRTGGADGRAGGFGQLLDQLHILFLPDSLSGGNHPFGQRDGDIRRNSHGKVVAILFQSFHQRGHLLLRSAVPEQNFLPDSGHRRALTGTARGNSLGFGLLTQHMRGNDNPLNFVGSLVDGGDFGVAVHPLHLHPL
ncbi:hypothetical protein SDC9_82632 [bioreactor metagenome]|uniref:Uncharacterized protein n=1 Tax=bioreactor metagenome TaxID=1076179 RepID=A0A644Z5Y9_9ZZZZ